MRNYFNYFTEVEEHFSRLRGKHLLVAPLDWCLIDLWKSSGIPLHVALRGIDRSFESAQRRKKKSPTTLFYCHPAVLEAFEEYAEAQVGASSDAPPAGSASRAEVLACLERLEQSLNGFAGEVFDRVRSGLGALIEETRNSSAVAAEEIDRELERYGHWIADHLLAGLTPQEAKDLKKEIRSHLKIYRKRLSKEMYSKLERNYLARTIRERAGLADFSLVPVSGTGGQA